MANEFPFFIKIQGIDKISGTLKHVQDRIKSVGQGFSSLATKMSLGLTLPIIGAATVAVHDYQESLAALKQVQNGLANSGGKVGLRLMEIKKAAVDLQNISLFDDDQILKDVSNRLLTFQNITGKTFIGAQKAIVDISSKFGTQLEPTAKAVGKALADPVHGMGALGKMGIIFTDSQKKAIKQMVATGQAARAQTYILSELSKRFKGSAEAARESDPYKALMVDLHNLAEAFGEIIDGYLRPFIKQAMGLIRVMQSLSPETKELIVKVLFFTAILGPVIGIIGQLIFALGVFVSLAPSIAAGLKLIGVAMLNFRKIALLLGSSLGWLFTRFVWLLASPITWWFVGIALAIYGVVRLVQFLWPLIGKLWEQFMNIDWVQGAVRKIGDAFNWLGDKIGRAWDNLTGFFGGLGRMKNIKGIDAPGVGSGFQVASVPTGSIGSPAGTGTAGKAAIEIDFKNMPMGIGVKTVKNSNTNLNLNMGYSMVGFG